MNTDEEVKTQGRAFFVGIILAVIIGMLGNLAVTSLFELFHLFQFSDNTVRIGLSYTNTVELIFVSAIILLFCVAYFAWVELKKYMN